MSVTVLIGAQPVPVDVVEAWERRRAVAVAGLLQRGLRLPPSDITREPDGAPRNLEEIRGALVDIKLAAGPDLLRGLLAARTAAAGRATRAIDLAGRRHRRSSVTELIVDGCGAEEMRRRYLRLMLRSGADHRRLGLIANPDHFVLEPAGDGVQEVVETTGGAALPSRFFVHYDDEDGLTTSRSPLFPVQLAGVCRLADGTPIGGIRHQLRDVGGGLHARLEVEFPALLPRWMIRRHQLHLACEFARWFSELAAHDPTAG